MKGVQLAELGLLRPPLPQQHEFARLNLNYTIMSKRKLLQLVNEGLVKGWDDPRMPTISALRRRGITSSAIRTFAYNIGITKYPSMTDVAVLEHPVVDHRVAVRPLDRDAVAPALATEGHTAFAIDLLGYGESDRPFDADYTLGAQAECGRARYTPPCERCQAPCRRAFRILSVR